MLFVKLFPKTIRLAFLYVKATKITKNKNLSEKEQLAAIYVMEKKCGGRLYLTEVASKSSLFSLTRAIGKKDMGRIFTSLNSPVDAFAYLEPALCDINFIKLEGKEKHIAENKVLILLYTGIAYTLSGKIMEGKNSFDLLNEFINEEIRKHPSDKRLNDLYRFCNRSIYNAFIDMTENYPKLENEIVNTCYKLLEVFESRDPGNEQIQNYIDRFN